MMIIAEEEVREGSPDSCAILQCHNKERKEKMKERKKEKERDIYREADREEDKSIMRLCLYR